MNGYVSVRFNEWGQAYTYMIPDYIDPDNIQDYVVVPNAFYEDGDGFAPYKIVKVESVDDKPGTRNKKATKYIVDIIDYDRYNNNVVLKDEAEEKPEDYTSSFWDKLDYRSRMDYIEQTVDDMTNEQFEEFMRMTQFMRILED
jgi:hypothetical protein